MTSSSLDHLLEWSFASLGIKLGALPSTVIKWGTIILHGPSLPSSVARLSVMVGHTILTRFCV